jgi:hypothetical protein
MNRSVRVAKDGYATGTVTITMTGDTQLDIRLERAGPYVLSGVVYEITEAGPLPLEGVQLYCDSCGSPGGHTFVGTDADGAYRFEWTYDGFHPLLVRKMGYRIIDSTGRLLDDWITASVRGDTRFDIQLVRR